LFWVRGRDNELRAYGGGYDYDYWVRVAFRVTAKQKSGSERELGVKNEEELRRVEEPSPLRYELWLLKLLWPAVVVLVAVVVVRFVGLCALAVCLEVGGVLGLAGPSIFISLPAMESENRLGGSSLE